MAGPRRAQYVSIPLGPGVLSNTTGRGARTRINYMNWDRWKDAAWVRWHKLLPEKQGGWQYQALVGQAIYPPLLQGSPDLLLHLNAVSTVVQASLLLHFDGANGSITFTDSSSVGNVVTANGTANITTSTPKFGTGSLGGLGSSGDSASTPIVASGPLDLSTGDFTIEFWIYPLSVSLGYSEPLVSSGYSTNGFYVWKTNAQLTFTFGIGSKFVNYPTPLVANTWQHVAAVRKGNVFDLFLNGVPSGTPNTVTGSIGAGSLSAIYVGASPGNFGAGFYGQIDDLRIIKGACIYNPGTNFTPPASAEGPTATVFLPSYADSGPYNWPMTPNGIATVSTTTFEFGNGALQLDGATASLSTPIIPGSPLDLSQGDFTIELWAYSENENNNLFLDMSDGGTAGLYFEQPSSGAQIVAHIWTGSSFTTLTGNLAQNTWTDVALVRQGGLFTLYIGGISAATTTYAGSIGPMGGNLYVGGGFLTSLLGFIDELRITSLALYTANYTPATGEGLLGLPNVLGAAQPPSAFLPATYLGVARDLHDWASIDGQYWIAIGTHLKLYVVNQAAFTTSRRTARPRT